jgi:hypothetical protein
VSFEIKKVYRPVNAAEWKSIMVARIQAALDADSTLNIMRSYPIFDYKISIALTPYAPQGTDQQGKPLPPKPGVSTGYEVDGIVFVPVFESAVELVEQSPIYGADADTQTLRTLAAQPTIEKGRSDIGEVVDLRVPPPKAKVELEPAEAFEPTAPPVPIASDEKEDQTIRVEEGRWGAAHPDPKAEAAIERRDPSLAAGRVSVIKSVAEGGGADHGVRGKGRR